MLHQNLLQAIQQRQTKNLPCRGIATADWYARSAVDCVGSGVCSRYFGKGFDAPKLLKEAAEKLTYGGLIETKGAATRLEDMRALLDGIELPKHALMAFPHVLTTPREDRDTDVLETDGAIVDPKMPMLWQHIHTLPIGKYIKTLEHTPKVLRLASVLLDINDLTNDAAKLIEAEALRFSHGFRALEFTERKDQRTMETIGGFRVTKFEIMEESLVSVPSNVDAEISLWDAGKLKSDVFKKHAKSMADSLRRVQGIGMDFGIQPAGEAKDGTPCGCKGKQGDLPRTNTESGVKIGLRKMFDVERERLDPSTIEISWAAQFIGTGVKNINLFATNCGGILRGGFMEAFEQVTACFKVADTRNLTSEGTERPPIFETIDIKSDRRKNFLTEGVRFLIAPDGWKLAYRTFESWHGQDYLIYAEDKDREKAQKLIEDAWGWLEKHNPLKGQAFQLTGGFLEKTGIKWDDVFLEPKNEQALKRAVKIIGDKGASHANRGIIMAGPPGTGKTLSGRVILNEADATFIWVSAKDFWLAGSYECFSGAFSLARKLAPSVVLYEDVDNWIDSYTVDLVKGEMDGLAQSTGVTTILTTNFPEKLPSALIDRPGRFHDVLELHLPSKEVRARMLAKWATGATPESLAKMADDTEGLSGAHLYELANFAKSIQDEDGCDLDGALVKALAKVHEQREIISQGQLAGSSYRPGRRAYMPGTKSGKAGRKETGMCKRCKKPMPLGPDGMCKECAAAVANDKPSQEPPKVEPPKPGEKPPKAGAPASKGGRALSQANYTTLSDAVEDMTELEGLCDKRHQKALCKACQGKIKSVLDQNSPAEPAGTEEKPAGEPMVKPERGITPEQAMAVLLSAEPELLRRVAKAADGLLKVHELDMQGKAFRATRK